MSLNLSLVRAKTVRLPIPGNGFTLIEVLVTIVVLSVGLLGLAGMHAKSLRNNNSAYHRTQAILLANDMADRIRSNPAGVAAGAYSNRTSSSYQSAPECVTNNSPCSAVNMAKNDLFEWGSNFASPLGNDEEGDSNDSSQQDTAVLPSGQGKITVSGNIFTITVMWDNDRSGATGTGCDTSNANDLHCFKLEFEP